MYVYVCPLSASQGKWVETEQRQRRRNRSGKLHIVRIEMKWTMVERDEGDASDKYKRN